MEIKNKLSLEKKSILTLNKVDMESVQGGTYYTSIVPMTRTVMQSGKRCWEIGTVISVTIQFIETVVEEAGDWLHDQSDTMEIGKYGSDSAVIEYGGCAISDIDVICS